MATTAVTVDQYLHTAYSPDCDYVDGEVLERALGEREHALLQITIAAWFFNHRAEWNIAVLPEQRVQTSPTRFRIPDVAVLRKQDPKTPIVHHPPLLCVEVLSDDDRMSRVVVRLEDYVKMGVENIWLLDPVERRAWTFTREGLIPAETETLRIAGTDIYLPLNEIWAELDA